MRRTTPALLLLLVAACTDRPKAPPLTDEAVFRDDATGLRFLAPAGWAMEARANVPAGRLPKVIVVVSYRRPTGARPATFEVLAADVPADADQERFLAEHGTGNERWAPRSPARPVQINAADAAQFVQARMQGKEEVRREATAFRRGDRVYFFVLTYSAAEPEVRDAVRSTVESITWAK